MPRSDRPSAGGLPFTVVDELTGLLVEPGNPLDLAGAIRRLLNDAGLRSRMGAAGRKRFEDHCTWQSIIDKHYHRLTVPSRSRNSHK
jgi:glycosyltransferase involved in cell wall biosynthesis